MCAAALGIHGIGQHKKQASALEESWRLAMQRSAALTSEPRKLPSFTIAFYGSLFVTQPDGRLGTIEETAPLSLDEEIFIENVLSPSFSHAEGTNEDAVRVLGLPAIPGSLGRLLVQVDRKFGRNAGHHLLYILRQVHRYLTNESLAKAIRNVVADSIKPDTSLVLAHSLGSVVAYDMAQRGELFQASAEGFTPKCMVTFGSPLSWPTVLRMLDHGAATQDFHLSWHNLYDPTDVVTGGQGLTLQGVHNQRVRNGVADPHAAVRYLRQPAIGTLLTSHVGI